MSKQPVYNLSEKEFSLLSKFGWMWFLTHPISQKLCQIMITENKWRESEASANKTKCILLSTLFCCLPLYLLLFVILTTIDGIFPDNISQIINIPVILIGFILSCVISSIGITKLYKPIYDTVSVHANKSDILPLPKSELSLYIGITVLDVLIYIGFSIFMYLNR